MEKRSVLQPLHALIAGVRQHLPLSSVLTAGTTSVFLPRRVPIADVHLLLRREPHLLSPAVPYDHKFKLLPFLAVRDADRSPRQNIAGSIWRARSFCFRLGWSSCYCQKSASVPATSAVTRSKYRAASSFRFGYEKARARGGLEPNDRASDKCSKSVRTRKVGVQPGT